MKEIAQKIREKFIIGFNYILIYCALLPLLLAVCLFNFIRLCYLRIFNFKKYKEHIEYIEYEKMMKEFLEKREEAEKEGGKK